MQPLKAHFIFVTPTFISDTQKYSTILLITTDLWEFPGGPGLGLCTSSAGAQGSIPGQGTKILQAVQHSQKKKNLFSSSDTQRVIQLLGIFRCFFSDKCLSGIPHLSPYSQICDYLREVNREGNGTPLQYSCLENPMDRGAW